METHLVPSRQRRARLSIRHRLTCIAFALAVLLVTPRAAHAQQTLYVVDNGTTIYKIAPDGTKTTFASGLGAVGPLALDTAGNLYAGYASASGYGGGIIRFAPDGTQSSFASYPTIANTTGLAFDASGHLFESEYGTDSNNNSNLNKITQGGVVSLFTQVPGSQRNLAFDAAGNLYVVDTAVGGVTKIAPDGTKSTFASGLNSPYGLAFDASGNLYVSNDANGSGISVIKITPDGTQSTFATGLAGPAGLAFDQYGNLFVANSAGTTVTEITPAGAKSTFASGFTSPTGLVFSAPTAPVVTTTAVAAATVGTAYSYQIATINNPVSYAAAGLPAGLSLDAATGSIHGTPTAGGAYTVSLYATNAYGTGSGILTLAISPGALQQTLYVTDSGTSVVKVAPDGTQGTFISGLGNVGPLAFDAAGNLYVGTDSSSGYGGDIYQYTPDGRQNTLTGYPTISDPTGLAFDANGNLFESEYNYDSSNNSTVHKITPDGTVSVFATVHLNQGGVAFDSHGNLFVASTGGNTVAKITSDGTVSTFATGLDEPIGLAIDASDNVYVANNGNGFGLTVSKITPGGVVSTYATGLEAPAGLAFDLYGNLYVANNATHGGGTITEITPNGAKGTFAAGFTNPYALLFGSAPVPVITSPARDSAPVGSAYQYQILANNDPTSYSASPLPPGLGINGTTGFISGVPTQVGTYTISLFATNAVGSGSSILTLTVTAATTPTPTPTPTPIGTPTPTPTPTTIVPTVAVTSPPDNITVVAGSVVPLAASVEDPDSVLAQVQFFVNGQQVASTGAAGPLTATATAPSAGTYVLQAIATDNQGRTSTASVTVTVVAADASNPAPIASLLTPIAGRNLLAGSALTLTATAGSSASAGLDHVTIYVEGAVIATFDAQGNLLTNAAPGTPTRRDASTTPLAKLFTTSFTLPGVDKLLTMIVAATDKLSHTSLSGAIGFHSTLTSDRAPLVAFSNLGATVQVPVGSTSVANITASDPDAGMTNAAGVHQGKARADAAGDGVLAKLEYYDNGVNVGAMTQSPFSFSFTPPLAGTYVLHAVATDGSGLATVSAPVVVEAEPVSPVVTVVVSGDGEAVEGGEAGKVVVRRTGDLTAALTVHYKVAGSAKAGEDYKAGSVTGAVTIPAGAAQAKIKIKAIDDSAHEGTLVAKIKLKVATDGSYTLGIPTVAKIKVIDND